MMDAARICKFHYWMAWFWTVSFIPTVVWWKESILWVAIMSLYANIGTSLGAYNAARAERKVDEQQT